MDEEFKFNEFEGALKKNGPQIPRPRPRYRPNDLYLKSGQQKEITKRF